MRTAALVCLLAAAATYLPSVIDRALRNRRVRQARAQARAECHANYWLDSSEPWDAWEPAESTPIHDALSFEFWERQMEGTA